MPVRTHTYGERDYTFGQAIATLRTAMNLTQVALGQCFGVSQGAVLGWEAGSSYHIRRVKPLGLQTRGYKRRSFWGDGVGITGP